MARDEQAIHPTFSTTTADEVEQIEQEDEEIKEREEAVADLKHHIGFQEIRKDIENTITLLRNGTYMQVDTGDPLDQIGQKFLIGQLAADVLAAELGKIDAAAEAKG